MSQQANTLEPLLDEEAVTAVFDAVANFDLTASHAWSDLDMLSSHTSFEDLEANVDGIFKRSDGTIEVVGTAYVTLQYGDKNDRVEMTDSYPAKIMGRFKSKKFQIDDVTVDTSSFYG